MTTFQLLAGLFILFITLGAILLLWWNAVNAPLVRYYCGFCNRAWGHYPNGRLYHQAVEHADRFDYWPLLCPHCHLEQRERECRESSREAQLVSGNARQNHTHSDAATSGNPRVIRHTDGSAEYWPQ